MNRRRVRLTAVVLAAVLGLGACSATPTRPVVAPPVPFPLPSTSAVPVGTATPSPLSSTLPSCTHSPASDPLRSWRPPPMPPPGDMPGGSAMRRIEDRGYLIAGVDQDAYDVSYRNLSPSPSLPTGGKPYEPYEGFDVDMLHAIAAAVFGAKGADRIRYVPVTQDYRIGAAHQGIVDVVADSATITCSRWGSVDFSVDYLNAAQALLVNADDQKVGLSFGKDRVPHVDGMRGGKICTVGSTTSTDTLATLQSSGDFRVVDAANWSDCMLLLQRGAVQAMSTDDTVLRGLQAQDPYLKVVGDGFSFEPHGLMFPRSDPSSKHNSQFVAFVNGVINAVERNSHNGYCPQTMTPTDSSCWAALYRTWFGPGPPHPPTPATVS